MAWDLGTNKMWTAFAAVVLLMLYNAWNSLRAAPAAAAVPGGAGPPPSHLSHPHQPLSAQQLKTYFPGPLAPAADPCQNGRERCIVSFAIYGKTDGTFDPYYLDGCLRNILQGRKYWPGWKLRFYTDDVLPPDYIELLTTPTSDVVVVDPELSTKSRGAIVGMFWRFFAISDPEVDRVIVRDTDSAPGSRERAALDEWVQSGKMWHFMRDSPSHNIPIVGCCFGAAKPWQRTGPGTPAIMPFNQLEGKIRAGFFNDKMFEKGGDQHYLWQDVLPRIDLDNDLITHDSYSCDEWASTKAWPTQRRGPSDMATYQVRVRHAEAVTAQTLAESMRQWEAVLANNTDEDPAVLKELTGRDIIGEIVGDNWPLVKCPRECRPPQHPEWEFC